MWFHKIIWPLSYLQIVGIRVNFSFVYNFIVLHFTVCVCVLTRLCLILHDPTGTITHTAPLSIGSSKQESWSGLPFPPPEDLPNPKIEPLSPVTPVLASWLFITEPPKKAHTHTHTHTYTHTHTHRGNIALNLISILRSRHEIFNLQSISYFFFLFCLSFSILCLPNSSYGVPFILPFSVLYSEHQLAHIHIVNVCIELGLSGQF